MRPEPIAAPVETSLHLAAKQLIVDRGWLRLPELEVTVQRTAPEVGLFTASKTFCIPKECRFHRVELERWVDGIRPRHRHAAAFGDG